MDLISRQAILKHIEKIRQSVQMMDDTRRASIIMNGMYLCEKAVMNQPSAQPERKKGEWLRYGEDGYPNNEDTVFWQCDQCLEQYTGRAKKIPNFCPNCGADMRGKE